MRRGLGKTSGAMRSAGSTHGSSDSGMIPSCTSISAVLRMVWRPDPSAICRSSSTVAPCAIALRTATLLRMYSVTATRPFVPCPPHASQPLPRKQRNPGGSPAGKSSAAISGSGSAGARHDGQTRFARR